MSSKLVAHQGDMFDPSISLHHPVEIYAELRGSFSGFYVKWYVPEILGPIAASGPWDSLFEARWACPLDPEAWTLDIPASELYRVEEDVLEYRTFTVTEVAPAA